MNPRTIALAPSFFGSRYFRIFAVSAALCIYWAIPASGSVITWTDNDYLTLGGEGDGNPDVWSDAGNWSSNSLPGIGDTAVFNTGINDGIYINTVFVDAPESVGNIFFDANAFLSTSGSEVGYTIEGYSGPGYPGPYALTLGSNGTIEITSTFAGSGVTQTMDVPLDLSGNATFSSNSAGNTLLFQGSIGAPGIAGPETITLNGSGYGIISGTIGTSGTISVLMDGPGTWTLSGDNAYTGATEIDGGTLNVATLANVNTGSSIGKGSSGGSAADLVFGGGILQYTGATAQSTTRLFTIGDANGLTATIDASGITSAATVTFGSTSALGVYSTASPLTLTLTGSNSGANTFAPVIANSGGGGAVSLVKSGTGTWDITATTSSYTGTTEIDGGILNVKSLANEGTASSIGSGAGSGSVTDLVFGGGTLQYTQTTGAATTNRLFTIGDANGSSATIDSSSTTAGDTVTFSNASGLGTYGTGNLTLTLTGSNTGNNTFDPGIGDGAGGITSLVKSGPGVWALGGTNTYSGSTTINGGILKISAAANLGDGAVTNTISLNGATLESTSGANSLVSNQSITLGGASTIQDDSGTLTIAGNLVKGGYLLTVGGSGNVTISGNVSGSAGITKSGTGTLTLTGNNTYTGALTLNGGVTNATTAGMDGASAASSLIFNTGTSTFQANSAGNVSISGSVGMIGAGAFDTNGQNITLSGLVYGAGALTKMGAGTLIFAEPNTITSPQFTFTGGLTITNGTAQQGSATDVYALGTGNITFGPANTPTLDLDGNNVTTGLLSGTAANGVVTNSGAAPATLTLYGSGSQTFGGVIQDGNSKTAVTMLAGTQILSGANTYTGGTIIEGGTLQVGNGTSGSLASGAALTFNGPGTFNVSEASGVSQTMGTLTFAAGDGTVESTNNGGSIALTFSSLAPRTLGATGNFVVTNGTNGVSNEITFTTPPSTTNALLDPGLFFSGSSYAVYDSGGYIRGLEYGTDANSPAGLTGAQTTLGTTTSVTNIQYNGAATGSTSTVSGSNANNTSTFTVANGALFAVGEPITGTGIPADTYITGISGNVLTVSSNLTPANVVPVGTTITPYDVVSAQPTAFLDTLNLNGVGASVYLASGATLSVNGILASNGTSGVADVISGGTGIEGPLNGDLVLRANAPADSLLIASPILASGTMGVTISGAGTVILAAAETYTGPTVVDNGVLYLPKDYNTNAPLSTSGIFLNGGTLEPPAVNNYQFYPNITIGPAGGTLTNGAGGTNVYLAGILSGAGTLTISGGGSFIPQNPANTFTGPIILIGTSILQSDTPGLASDTSVVSRKWLSLS